MFGRNKRTNKAENKTSAKNCSGKTTSRTKDCSSRRSRGSNSSKTSSK